MIKERFLVFDLLVAGEDVPPAVIEQSPAVMDLIKYVNQNFVICVSILKLKLIS